MNTKEKISSTDTVSKELIQRFINSVPELCELLDGVNLSDDQTSLIVRNFFKRFFSGCDYIAAGNNLSEDDILEKISSVIKDKNNDKVFSSDNDVIEKIKKMNPYFLSDDDMWFLYDLICNSKNENVKNEIGSLFGFQDLEESRNLKTLKISILTKTKALQYHGVQALTGNDNDDADGRQYEIKTKKVRSDYRGAKTIRKNYYIGTSKALSQNVLNRYKRADWIIAVFKGKIPYRVYFVCRYRMMDYYKRWQEEINLYGKVKNSDILLSDIENRGTLLYDSETKFYMSLEQAKKEEAFENMQKSIEEIMSETIDDAETEEEFVELNLNFLEMLKNRVNEALEEMEISPDPSVTRRAEMLADKYYNYARRLGAYSDCDSMEDKIEESDRIYDMLEDYLLLL